MRGAAPCFPAAHFTRKFTPTSSSGKPSAAVAALLLLLCHLCRGHAHLVHMGLALCCCCAVLLLCCCCAAAVLMYACVVGSCALLGVHAESKSWLCRPQCRPHCHHNVVACRVRDWQVCGLTGQPAEWLHPQLTRELGESFVRDVQLGAAACSRHCVASFRAACNTARHLRPASMRAWCRGTSFCLAVLTPGHDTACAGLSGGTGGGRGCVQRLMISIVSSHVMLTAGRYLDLNGNHLTGSIPSTLGNLVTLQCVPASSQIAVCVPHVLNLSSQKKWTSSVDPHDPCCLCKMLVDLA